SPVGYSLSATPSTDLSTLSLHDALPIFPEHVAIARRIQHRARTDDARGWQTGGFPYGIGQQIYWVGRYNKKAIEACLHDRFNDRSEEHTSELQSRFDLVCRLLLEKKNRK